jgi:uncharacterized membrane protein
MFREAKPPGDAMMVILAGLAILLLIVREVAAIAPVRQSQHLQRAALWGALPLLIIFGVMWLVHLRDLLAATP